LGLRVLLTEFCMHLAGGENFFVYDLILELARQGHAPALCAPLRGPISDALQAHGIPVVKHLSQLKYVPDIIHGHSRTEVIRALQYWRKIPAIFGVCPTFYTPENSTRWGPFSIKSATSQERYFIA